MPLRLVAILLIGCSPLFANSGEASKSDGTPQRPDYWGARLEAHAGATFFGSPHGNGVGHSHRFVGQAALLPDGSPWTPILLGADFAFDHALIVRGGTTANLFHWSASAIGSIGFNFGAFLWKPFVTWGNLGMYLNAIIGACGIDDPIRHERHVGLCAGGEISTGQLPFPHYDGIVLRVAIRGGVLAEAYISPKLTLLNAWCILSFYPGKSVVGFSFTYRYLGHADPHSEVKSQYFSLGVAIQL